MRHWAHLYRCAACCALSLAGVSASAQTYSYTGTPAFTVTVTGAPTYNVTSTTFEFPVRIGGGPFTGSQSLWYGNSTSGGTGSSRVVTGTANSSFGYLQLAGTLVGGQVMLQGNFAPTTITGTGTITFNETFSYNGSSLTQLSGLFSVVLNVSSGAITSCSIGSGSSSLSGVPRMLSFTFTNSSWSSPADMALWQLTGPSASSATFTNKAYYFGQLAPGGAATIDFWVSANDPYYYYPTFMDSPEGFVTSGDTYTNPATGATVSTDTYATEVPWTAQLAGGPGNVESWANGSSGTPPSSGGWSSVAGGSPGQGITSGTWDGGPGLGGQASNGSPVQTVATTTTQNTVSSSGSGTTGPGGSTNATDTGLADNAAAINAGVAAAANSINAQVNSVGNNIVSNLESNANADTNALLNGQNTTNALLGSLAANGSGGSVNLTPVVNAIDSAINARVKLTH